ncbi:uncharacterized protein LOC126319965 [Schistocerca gregaria]|uniref:uncharacterized protein LOC126319965 n=1 Tax=Schistocerca gregaria TaxID=7010 RepID=UPI00211DA47B|nr:uncharacterized protein LOC126319965 [Schistocerca gregaria]
MPLLSGMVTSIDPFIRKTSNQSYLPCQCGVVIWNHFTLVCIADGLTCNAASRQACECAVKAVVSEFRALNLVSNELRRTVAGILKCYSLAHKRILENQKIIWNAGTTTLLVCVTVEVEPCEASEFCKWCCISVSIGNGRVYYWNRQEGRVQEVTRHSEYADPGGRIGPYIYNGCPDLRNFEVSYKFCSAGDVIFLCSRNLYEKFDPEYLGVMPNEVRALKSSGTGDADQLPDKWKDLDANTSFSLRKLYEIHALEKKINGLEIVSPSQIVAALMGHYIKTHYLKVDRSASFEPHTTTGFKDFEYAACIVYAIGPPANTVT